MRALASSAARQPFIAAALVVSSLFLASCSAPTKTVSQPQPDNNAQRHVSWKPHLLYLVPSPHRRLYVEVDAVKGCEPDDVALEKLRAFLSTHCNKPDGIEIVRSDVISVEAARGFSEGALARKYITGPGKADPSPAAFMYVLYYNDAFCRPGVRAKVEQPGASMLMSPAPKLTAPYAETFLYPAIYFNTRFSMGIANNEILLHEAGHLLNLVHRPLHARNGHCLNRGCQMNTHWDYLRQFRWLPGKRQSPLCAECVAELKQRSTQSPVANVRYVGAALVRSETDYHVVTVPDRMSLIVGNFSERDSQEFAVGMRSDTPGQGDDSRTRLYCRVKDEVLKDPRKLNQVVDRFKNDPFADIRREGPKLFLRACAARYNALSQYSNIVATLHQAILMDPKDAGFHNQLGWIKATCPDASIRNGNDAVSAAIKACELTAWRNWGFIDTLAAAFARAGDFKRAIEFQERALRTGDPTESQQNGMRERLSLYKHAQPFLELPKLD